MLATLGMLIGGVVTLVLFAAGFKLGSTRGTWTMRATAALGCAAAMVVLLSGGYEVMQLCANYISETHLFCLTLNLLAFSAGALMASLLSSPVPAHNMFLLENESKPSTKAALLSFSLADDLRGIKRAIRQLRQQVSNSLRRQNSGLKQSFSSY
jgi:hypothetical protein